MIKILIVDDSKVETQLLKHLLESQSDMNVIACARDGAEAIEMTKRYSPDLITMDLEMPVMDGHTATRIIMSQSPTPIVVVSSKLNETSRDMTYLALDAGAVSVLPKPIDGSEKSFEKFRTQLINTVRSMSEIKVIKRRFNQPILHEKKLQYQKSMHKPGHFEIIAIGTSIGGPQVLKNIISQLPSTFSVPIVIVQHMASGFMSGFTQWLNTNSPLTIKTAENNEILKSGVIYFAPDHSHLTIERSHKNLIAKLIHDKPVSGFCPSITVLLKSIAKSCQQKAIGILLTGMGSDGAEGLLELKQAGSHTIIQDKKSCVVFGMASIAQSMGAVDRVVEINQMADYIITMTSQVI